MVGEGTDGVGGWLICPMADGRRPTTERTEMLEIRFGGGYESGHFSATSQPIHIVE
jgi:hypothetical protein